MNIFFATQRHTRGIVEQYNQRAMEKNGHVYDEIRKGMYILLQEGQIENNYLTKKPHTTWILPVSTHTRPMEGQIDTSNLFFGSK